MATKKKNTKSKKVSTTTLLTALLYIVIGILFIAFKSSMLDWVMTITGILAIAYGIYLIIKRKLVLGIIFAAVGVALILGGWLFLEIVLLVLGVALVIYGAVGVIEGIQKKRGFITILLSVLTIVVGVLFIVNKWAAVDWVFIVCGVILIIDGAIGFFVALSRK